jgi:predicted  nucleic acid-binding Zn-ribbon protein
VSVESFTKLKEIESLNRIRGQHLKARLDQEERLHKLLTRREDSQGKANTLKEELIKAQDRMAEIEQKIKLFSKQKQNLQDLGGSDEKIHSYTSQIEILENQGLQELSQIEDIEKHLSENKLFLAGLENTIKDIESEVNTERDKLNHEISNVDLRIKLLQDELPSDFKALLMKISSKNLAHGPFTRIDQGSCYFCRFKISRLEESEIDMLKNLKTCPQCSRIFLPYGA